MSLIYICRGTHCAYYLCKWVRRLHLNKIKIQKKNTEILLKTVYYFCCCKLLVSAYLYISKNLNSRWSRASYVHSACICSVVHCTFHIHMCDGVYSFMFILWQHMRLISAKLTQASTHHATASNPWSFTFTSFLNIYVFSAFVVCVSCCVSIYIYRACHMLYYVKVHTQNRTGIIMIDFHWTFNWFTNPNNNAPCRCSKITKIL